jgi:branched-chain amino acid aminotransferase
MHQQFNEKNRDLLVNINGMLLHRDQAGISPFDSAVQGGDAVWEGLRLYNGRIFKLIEHLDRLRDSAKAMAFAQIPTHQQLITEIRKTLIANNMSDGVHIRLTLTRGVKYTSGMDPRLNTQGPTLIVLAEHKPPVYDKAGLTLITSSIRRIPPECVDQKIHSCNLINSILAKIQANAAGADDALMLDLQGFVAETNATHIFIVKDGVVLTPYTNSCPEGITRSVVLKLCQDNAIPYEVRDITLAEVYRADEMFCTGTMGELASVTSLDGRTIGNGDVGAMTQRLTDLFDVLTKSAGIPVIQTGNLMALRQTQTGTAQQAGTPAETSAETTQPSS